MSEKKPATTPPAPPKPTKEELYRAQRDKQKGEIMQARIQSLETVSATIIQLDAQQEQVKDLEAQLRLSLKNAKQLTGQYNQILQEEEQEKQEAAQAAHDKQQEEVAASHVEAALKNPATPAEMVGAVAPKVTPIGKNKDKPKEEPRPTQGEDPIE